MVLRAIPALNSMYGPLFRNLFHLVVYSLVPYQMECAQVKITGGGSAKPATVSFPGAYAGLYIAPFPSGSHLNVYRLRSWDYCQYLLPSSHQL
jgi:hypothetical protein